MRPRRLKLGTRVDKGQMYRVYGNQAAPLIRPFISSFTFLSNFQTLKYFVTFFSGNVRPRRLQLGTHVDNGRCIVFTGNRLCLLIRPFISSFFFLSNFQTLNVFVTLFSGTVRPRRLNLVHTWTMGSCIAFSRIRLLLHIRPFISSFFFLSSFQTLKFFVTLFSRTVRPRRLTLGTHLASGQMYSVYWNQAAAAYSSLYL